MIEVLLVIIILLQGAHLFRAHRQHKELIEWLDAYAEMVGEAIDQIKGPNQ